MDPRYRLKRKYPGEALHRKDSLAVRVMKRWVNAKTQVQRAVVGESFQARIPKARASRLYVRPEPNSPLLKRICKNPYQEKTNRGRRTSVRSPVPWTYAAKRIQSQPAMLGAREFAGSVIFGCPLQRADFSRHPEPRHRLSIEAWLGQQEGRR